jgi:hypothetical protein
MSCVRGDDQAEFSTPYRAAFVDQIRAKAPSYARRWDPEKRTWTVREPYVDEVLNAARAVFGHIALLDRRLPHPADWAAAMFAATPAGLHERLYKRLALVLHPDQGGDLTAMQSLAAAYDGQHRRAS